MPTNTTFTKAARSRLRGARKRLDYVSFGIISDVARDVGCQRQYAHSVIRDPLSFDKHHGKTAQKVWYCLERRLEQDKHLLDVEKIVTNLRGGNPIGLKMSSRFYTFLVRRLKRLGIKYKVTNNGEAPATYFFEPL